MGLGEIHAGKLAHNNVDLSNVLLVRDEAQASGVRCCWTGLSLAKKTDNAGNVRLTPEERLGRLMRQDDYYQVTPKAMRLRVDCSRIAAFRLILQLEPSPCHVLICNPLLGNVLSNSRRPVL